MLPAPASLDLGRYLTFLSARQEVIAANIANIDTPGYKTLDVEDAGTFSSALANVRDSVEEVEGLASRNDGNNVSIDREARLLAENGIRFNLAVQLVRSRMRTIRSAIEEGHS